MSRNDMRELKTKKDEELRIERINACVSNIYHRAVEKAKTSTETSFSLEINPQKHPLAHMEPLSEYQFYKANMTEILVNLWGLFPECTVKLAKMCRGNDGKYYDISTVDDRMRPFINQQQTSECIVVDWS